MEFTKVVYRGSTLEGYYVDPNGDIWSTKQCPYGKKLKIKTPPNKRYPIVQLSVNAKQIIVSIHRLVAETFHKKPLPNCLTPRQWDMIPSSLREILVKTLMDDLQVNHIDHDRSNYHPSNLEWVTGSENILKYQEYNSNKLTTEANLLPWMFVR